MAILHDDPATVYDEAWSGINNPRGFTGGRDETPADVYPGDTKLDDIDPFEADMNLLAALTAERRRLRELVPGAAVIVSKHVQAYESDFGPTERCEWQVSVRVNDATGICYTDVATTTLREACDSALSKFRADVLDKASVATKAETVAA